MTRRPLLGAALLFVTAVVWGFAFVPQKLTVIALLPLQATALRFVLAAPVALALANRRLTTAGVAPKHAIGLGLLLFVVYALQTWALVLTPVSRVVLITGLYAVFVPLLAPLVGLAKPTRLHWIGAGIAFAGLIGLVGAVGVDDATAVALNFGDVLVFIHAVLSAFYILLVGRLASTADAFALNGLQLAGLAVIAVPVALLVEGAPDVAAIDGRTWLSFAYLAVFSTVVAFTSQIIGQRHVSPPTAAAIMLLETPVGVLGALLLFNEAMAPVQWIGAGVLLLGVVTSLYAEIRISARY